MYTLNGYGGNSITDNTQVKISVPEAFDGMCVKSLPCKIRDGTSQGDLVGPGDLLVEAEDSCTKVCESSASSGTDHGHDTALFPRLVLGWIEADFRVQIRILQHFSKSTRKSSSREEICKFLPKIINFEPFLKVF